MSFRNCEREQWRLQVRNPIYRRVFDASWIRKNRTVNWLKVAAYAGAATLGIVVLIAALLAPFAYIQRNEALKARDLATSEKAKAASAAADEARQRKIAEQQRQLANDQRRLAEQRQTEALAQKRIADQQRRIAGDQKITADSLRLVAQAQLNQDSQPDLALLLGLEAYKL